MLQDTTPVSRRSTTTAALVMVGLWCAVLAAAGLLTAVSGAQAQLGVLALAPFVLLVLSLNLVVPTVIVGLVDLLGRRPRAWGRALAWLVSVIAVLPASLWLVGATTGDGDDIGSYDDMNLVARGGGLLVLAVVLLGLAAVVLDVLPRGIRPDRRTGLIAGIGLASVAVVLAGLAVLNRPTVVVVNDTGAAVRVEYCPGQECEGLDHGAVDPGDAVTLDLRDPRDDSVLDSVEVTTREGTVACLFFDRGAEGMSIRHLELRASDARADEC